MFLYGKKVDDKAPTKRDPDFAPCCDETSCEEGQECMPNPVNEKCYKKVWVDAVIESSERTIVVRPAWTETIVTPPVWNETVEVISCEGYSNWEKRDCDGDESVCYVTTPGSSHEIPVFELIEEGKVETIEHPEETTIVTCDEVICPGYYCWEEVICPQ